MSYNDFILSIENDELPPNGLPLYVQALWWDAKGNWQKAHGLIDALTEKNACRVHAYLHRKEGDSWNADYWYNRAKTSRPQLTLQQEWQLLATELL